MLESVFPTELYERIIDYVGQAVDSPTLRVCALVSRTWYPRARLHLLRSVRLVDRQDALAFTHMIRGGHGPLGLTDARGMVERLIVRGVESESNRVMAKGTEKKTRRSLVHLGTCAAMLAGRARLDNLTYLGIAEGDWRGLHPKIGMHLNAAFPRLRWIDLYNVQFFSTPDFGRFLCAFACLQQASVWVPARGQSATQNPSSTPFDPAAFIDKTNGMRLNKLTLNGRGSTKNIGEFLIATGAAQKLTEVWVGGYEQVPIEEVGPLISAATSLLGLDITLGNVDGGEDTDAGSTVIPLDLTPNVRLRILMLRLKAVRLDWVPAFLQCVSAKTIEGVTVIFDVRRPQPDDTMSIRDRLLQTLHLQLCTAVDGLLCGIEDPHARQNSVDGQSMDKSGLEKGCGEASLPVYTYPRLHTVQFALWVRSDTLKSAFDSMEWTELLQGRFPLLHARKMLRAVVVLEDSTDFLHEK